MFTKSSMLNPLERVTEAIPVITTDHAFIHEGIAFTVANKVDIASAKVAGLQVSVPAGIYCHFKPAAFANTGGPVIISMLEDYTFTGGSAITPANRKRVGTPAASQISVKGSADITAVAGSNPVSLDMTVLPGTSTGGKLGGSAHSAEEWVLKPGGNYLVTMTNATSPGATVTVGYELFWYEEASS